MRKYLYSLALLLSASTMEGATGYTNFNYGSNNPVSQILWGTTKQEPYDVAMKITDKALVGKEISAITIPVPACEGISDYSIWLSNALTIESTDEGKVNVPDIASFKCEPTDGTISVTLDTPIVIPNEGIYVGYSFAMSQLGNEEQAPIFVTEYTYYPDSFYIHTKRSYKTWKNISESLCISPVINVRIEGEFTDNCLDAVRAKEINIANGYDAVLSVTLHNTGGNPVDSFHYTILKDEKVVAEETFLPDTPILPEFYGTVAYDFPIPWDAIGSDAGNYSMTFNVVKANDQQNGSESSSTPFELNIMSFIPNHRPVLEEYTGLWCGNCPRGYVSLEIMSHLYPNDFIGISYHNGDEMEVVSQANYPNSIIGYPDSWIDRVEETDPYSGHSSSGFGMDKLWELYRSKLAPADIELTASFTDEEQSAVEITANTIFAKKSPNVVYAHVYMLLGDGMTKDNWFQTNYYSGSNDFDNSPYRDYWTPFVEGGHNIGGLTYNDILLAATDLKGIGNELLSDYEIGNPVASSHSFTLSEVRNVRGKEIIQDKNQLYAVVLLVNTNTGAIENANKCKVTGDSGVDTIVANGEVASTEYYDLTGRKITTPANGMYIRVDRLNNGTVRTSKMAH